jgi:EmrB/QacA subfamily drug resistance transporter
MDDLANPPAVTAPVAAVSEALDPNRWAALAVLLVGAFLAPLDFFICNVAMPAITEGLHASAADVQLVISGYAVVYAVFLITGGRLGDIYGRKTIFLVGLTGFAIASGLCGLAWSPLSLILARLLQAFTAALMAPQALSSVHALFPPHERGRALSIYAVALGLSSAIGQMLGGFLVAADVAGLGWRLVFLINLPVAIIAVIAAIPLLKQTHSAHRPTLDWGGVILSSLALSALVVPLVEGREQGWPIWSIIMLIAAPFLAFAFCRFELRVAARGGDPLVAVEVFETPGLLRGLGAILTLYAMAAFFLTYSIYLQEGLGFTAFQAGMAIVPFSLGLITGSTASPTLGRWMGRFAPSLGFAMSAGGLLCLSALTAWFPTGHIPPWSLMTPALVLLGLGLGMSFPTMVRVIVERVAPQRAGLVGGVVNSVLQVSAALGVALLGGLFYVLLAGHSDVASITHAFSYTLLGVACCHILGGALAAGLGQKRAA